MTNEETRPSEVEPGWALLTWLRAHHFVVGIAAGFVVLGIGYSVGFLGLPLGILCSATAIAVDWMLKHNFTTQ